MHLVLEALSLPREYCDSILALAVEVGQSLTDVWLNFWCTVIGWCDIDDELISLLGSEELVVVEGCGDEWRASKMSVEEKYGQHTCWHCTVSKNKKTFCIHWVGSVKTLSAVSASPILCIEVDWQFKPIMLIYI